MGLSLGAPPPRSWDALVVIDAFMQANGMSPTMAELAKRLNLRAVSAARRHVVQLEELGLVSTQRTGRHKHIAARSIRVTAEGGVVLGKYRTMRAAGILQGETQLVLTEKQLHLAREHGVPVDSFAQVTFKGKTVLRCRNWRERDFWAERIVEATEGSNQ